MTLTDPVEKSATAIVRRHAERATRRLLGERFDATLGDVSMRIAVCQIESPVSDTSAALARLEPMLRAASAAGAEVLVAPEALLPGYNNPRIAELAQVRGGPWHRALMDLARQAGCALVAGYAERADAMIFNAAVAFGPNGSELAHYRKIQLFGPREKAIYRPGEDYCTFLLGGRRLGLLICYDVEFAAHVAALAARGVEAVLVPTANMLPFTHVMEATVPAMAANHGLAIAYANYCGTEGDMVYAGTSVIAGPHGEVLARAGPTAALLIADLSARDPARLSTQAEDFRLPSCGDGRRA